MTKEEAREQFTELVARDDNQIELDRAALLIAAEEYPHLELGRYLAQLDFLAEQVRRRPAFLADGETRLLDLNDYFFNELGFTGNAEDYHDARNSFLNDVLDRRIGIPITLSVVYMEIARRLSLSIVGVGLPGHFIVKYCGSGRELLIDPFHRGRILSRENCRELVEQMYGGALGFHPSFLNAVTRKQILSRMLQNLKGIYARATDYAKMLAVIERALLIGPPSPTEIRDRGLAYFGLGRYTQALADLEAYLRRLPQAEDADLIKERIADLRQRQAQLN
jgi:regulator of sirC expression with transglutaminase-like and TPR domain